MIDRPSVLMFVSLVPAIIALVGLSVAPTVVGGWDSEVTYIAQSLVGLPILLIGTPFLARRRASPRIRRSIPIATGIAGASGIAIGVLGNGLPDPAVILLVLLVFGGLATAHGLTLVGAVFCLDRRGRLGTTLGILTLVTGGGAIIGLMLMTLEPIQRPAVSVTEEAGRLFGGMMLLGGWSLLSLLLLDRGRRTPEFGGRVERPPVRFTCPRCAEEQPQDGARGCRRCGLDVRIELA